MNWLNVSVTTLHDEVFLGASPCEKGIWLSLMTYCVSMENSGSINGCGPWGDRQWMTACGLSKADVDSESRLWTWNPMRGCLFVYGYPIEQQEKVKALRKAGRKGARLRWKPKNVIQIQDKSEAEK